MSLCRRRISVISWLIGFILALDPVLRIPTQSWQHDFFGTPLKLTLDHSVLLLLILALVTGSGARWVTDAASSAKRPHWSWPLPVAWSTISLLTLQQAHDILQWGLGLLISVAMLATIMEFICRAMRPGQDGYTLARFSLSVVTYLAASVLFLFVYASRTRSLLSAPLMMIISTLLLVELLRNVQKQRHDIFFVATLAGLVIGETTWLFNHIPLMPLQAALFLLLIFYLVSSASFHAVNRDFSRRLVWEYLSISVIALMLIFWQGH